LDQNNTTIESRVFLKIEKTDEDQTYDADSMEGNDFNSMAVVKLSNFTDTLRNIHIVMIGDTVMRYQYLSLAYRLRHGRWFQDDSFGQYDLMNEPTFRSPFHDRTRDEFLFQTNNILQPMEVCDCFTGSYERDKIENRYFYDPILNNSIVYLAAFGHTRPLKGRLLPHQVRNQSKYWQTQSLRQRKDVLWHYNNWDEAIREYVQKLDPLPRHIVMNAGFWEHRFGKPGQPTNESNPWSRETHDLLKVAKGLEEVNFVWKTTTFKMTGQKPRSERDGVMCTLLPNCLNLSFTEYVATELYWDQFHFKEPVYRAANEKMLDLLQYLPNDYKRLELSSIMRATGNKSSAKEGRQQVTDRNDDEPLKYLSPSTMLRDLHIVMIGDSLMRFQYLSLAYRLRYGVWFDESMWHYNLVHQGNFSSPFHSLTWGEFLFQSNNMLHPYELCDCYRQPHDVVENRYYFDPILNNSILFVSGFGHLSNPLRGRLLPGQIYQERSNRSSMFKRQAFRDRGEMVWEYSDWGDMILNYVRHLDHRPSHIVMNAGHWPHRFCGSDHRNKTSIGSNANETSLFSNETQNLLRAMETMPESRFVWRTTTIGKDRKKAEFECDEFMCKILPICVNVSFTQRVRRKKYFVDRVHFYEPVYRAMNEQMLHSLEYLPKGYVRLKLNKILK
jgi:hypothetical protein